MLVFTIDYKNLEICERNERLIIISASSDCNVSLWDVHGTRIGTFGQVCWYSPEIIRTLRSVRETRDLL